MNQLAKCPFRFVASFLIAIFAASVHAQSTHVGPQRSIITPYDGAAVTASGKRISQREFRGNGSPWMADAIKIPGPNYPSSERGRRHEGAGLFRMDLDVKTGSVSQVTVVKSTGFPVLDESAVKALTHWRFKPNAWKQIDLPVNFEMYRGGVGGPQPGPNSIPLVPLGGGLP